MVDVSNLRPTDEQIDKEFTPAQRDQLLAQIQQEWRQQPVPLHRHRWAAVGVAAAAGITALAVGWTFVGASDTQHPVAGDPGVAVESSADEPSQDDGSDAPEAENPVVDTALALEDVAVASEGLPAERGGEYLHITTVSTQQDETGEYTITEDRYIADSGWTWRQDQGDQNFFMLYHPDEYGEFEALPTDPQELYQTLREQTGSHSADERVFATVTDILLSGTASNELRTAAIRALTYISEHPQAGEETKEGTLATPELKVEEIETADGPGYRITFTDEGSRPGLTDVLEINDVGDVQTRTLTADGMTYTSVVEESEWVDDLPSEFVEKLGTDEKHVEVDG